MSTSPNAPTDAERHGMEMEYNILKNEMLRRIEMRQQIVAVTLTLAGALLSVGLSTTAPVALIYPLLSMFLGLGWAQNDFRIRQSARYIRENLEGGKIPGLNYETHVQKQREVRKDDWGSWRFIVLSHGGIFLLTQLMAIGISMSKFPLSPLEWILLVIDLAATGVVIWLIGQALSQWAKTA
jgi:hypothetical protein